jgi:hypothetical protein
MGIDSFRQALETWIRDVLERAEADRDTVVEPRQWSWSRWNPTPRTSANWAPDYLFSLTSSETWNALSSAASSWPRLSEHVGKMVGSSEIASYTRVDLDDLVFPFVPKPNVEQSSGAVSIPSFSAQSFDESFRRFREQLDSSDIRYLTTTLLPGIAVDDSLLPVRLSKEIAIERLDPDDVKALGDLGLIRHPVGSIFVQHPDQQWLALRVSKSFAKVIVDDPVPSTDALMRWQTELEHIQSCALQALALTKYGTVGLGGQMTVPIGWEMLGNRLQPSRGDYADLQRDMTRLMRLDAEDCEQFRRLFATLLSAATASSALSIAVRRLTWSMENQRDEDRLLDDMIAAEAVLGDPSSKTELRYKFALRAAFALEPVDAKRRREIFEDMKRAYDVRSAVVHGTAPKQKDLRIAGEDVRLPVFVRRTEDYIRRIVRGLVLGKLRSGAWDDTIVGEP